MKRWFSSNLIAGSLIVVCSFLFSVVAVGDTVYVDPNGYADFTTIQAAIDDAGTGTGDIVIVLSGTYVENINLSGKSITLRSSDPTNPSVVATTVIDGGAAGSVITCATSEDPNTVIEGFTITNGISNSGAGMYNQGSSSTVRYCIFTANHSNADGGGMSNLFNSAPIISHCTFSNNTAVSQAGGMYNYSSSSPTITDCTFTGNSTEADGGGMVNNSSSPTITRCTFNNNTADAQGGGMVNTYSSFPKVTDCTFSDNTADSAGGMYNSKSSPTVTNCTFSGNEATNAGGGGMLNASSSSPTVSDCTFTGNTTGGNGGGMHNTSSTSAPIVSDCTFNNNTATAYGGGMYNLEFSSTVTNCTFSGNTAYEGGGMFNYYYSSPTVSNCTFSSNTASNGNGDWIYNYYYSSPMVRNCILWGNSETTSGDEIHNNNNCDPNFMYCDIAGSGSTAWNSSFGTDGGGNIDADPNFVEAANDNLRLQAGSPCIDAADSTGVAQNPEMLDRDGNPRAIDDSDTQNTGISIDVPALGTAFTVDIGAYEYQPCTPTQKGDLNCDDKVDMRDLAILAGNWLAGT